MNKSAEQLKKEREEFELVDKLAKQMIKDMNIDLDNLNIEVIFNPLCKDCGKAADKCSRCKSKAVYKDNLCGACIDSSDDDLTADAFSMPFQCSSCRLANPWKWIDNKEIVEYHYEKAKATGTVSRRPVYARKNITTPEERALQALSAYNKELSISGSAEEALSIFKSFYNT